MASRSALCSILIAVALMAATAVCAEDRLFFANGSLIRSIDLATSQATNWYLSTPNFNGMGYDPVIDSIIAGDENKKLLRMPRLAPAYIEFSTQGASILGLAVEPNADGVWIFGSRPKFVSYTGIENSLPFDTGGITSLAVDPIRHKLYYTSASGALYRCNSQGMMPDIELLVDSGIPVVNGSIALDLLHDYVYWIRGAAVVRTPIPDGVPLPLPPSATQALQYFEAPQFIAVRPDLADPNVINVYATAAGIAPGVYHIAGDITQSVESTKLVDGDSSVKGLTLVVSEGSCSMDSNGNGIVDCGENVDSDHDGVPDGLDGCPQDPAKTAPGACGCGIPETDSDSDSTPDCSDGCDADPNKTSAGVCGCGVSDGDSDGDGTPDCNDGCPADADKTAPGPSGCSSGPSPAPSAPIDSDGDGVPDAADGCAADSQKTLPGQCGCGAPDTDWDGDETSDCHDACPHNPLKTNNDAASVCGDAAEALDTDGDGWIDGQDDCVNNLYKHWCDILSVCGVVGVNRDADGDGVPDYLDDCSNNGAKTEADWGNPCFAETALGDLDGDAKPDGQDGCPNDPSKTNPGICGCGVPDIDKNGNGIPACMDSKESTAVVYLNTVLLRPLAKPGKKGDVKLFGQAFAAASLQSELRLAAARGKTGGKKQKDVIGFRYVFEVRTLPQGGPVGVRTSSQRKISRRNRVVFRRMKPGQYAAKYKVEITRGKQPAGSTGWSPVKTFAVEK